MRKTTRGMTLPEKVDFWLDSDNEWSEWSGDCLIWQGALAWNGYGKVSHTEDGVRTHYILSRLVCIIKNGEPPVEGDACEHACGNRACINPEHLYWGSTKSNNRESRRNKRQARQLDNLETQVRQLEQQKRILLNNQMDRETGDVNQRWYRTWNKNLWINLEMAYRFSGKREGWLGDGC